MSATTPTKNKRAQTPGFLCHTSKHTTPPWDNWDMVQIAEVNAKDKRELHATERRYVEQLGATLNRQVPTKTTKRY